MEEIILLLVLFISIWELYWKGRGCWKAAQKKDLKWFVAMLVLNTAGLLPIFYLGYFSKKKK